MNWALATEDALSEAVGVRLLLEHGIVPSQLLKREGFGYLKSRAKPEILPDPKRHLLELAMQAPRALRDDLVRIEAGRPRQAPGYNARLAAWVQDAWHPARAAKRAPSLSRARDRVAQFAARARSGGG